MAKRKRRTPPTPSQRRWAMVIGGLLVFLACAVVLGETIINEGGRPITIVIISVVLFFVFILPIMLAVRDLRRRALGSATGI